MVAAVAVQLLSHVWLFVTTWTTVDQFPLSFTISRGLLNFTFIESVMLSKHLILCYPFYLQSFSASGPFSKESALGIRWPKYWSFSFSLNTSNEYSGLISFRDDWFDFLAVQGTLKRVFSSTTIWKPQFLGAQPSLWSNSHIYTWLLERL